LGYKGLALAVLERHEEAIGCYDNALEIDLEYVSAWHGKGLALAALERHEEAVRCFDRALEINPDLEIAKKYRTLAEKKLREQQSRIPTTPPNQINGNMAEEQFSNGGSLATSGRYGGAKTMNIGMNLEIHFHQQDEASVYLESVASGKDEKFGEILLFCCFALRTMSNFGRHSIASSLATMLSQIGDHLIELPNRHSPDEAKLVSYQGNQGRKRFVAKLRYNDKNFTFKFKPKGLFLTGGIDYYAPNSVMILLRYLVEKRIDDEAFISSLSQATKKCGEAYIGRQISMWTHNQTALTIASSVTEMG
jgi:tetratricopeptide (TPR) repeat protein